MRKQMGTISNLIYELLFQLIIISRYRAQHPSQGFAYSDDRYYICLNIVQAVWGEAKTWDCFSFPKRIVLAN